MEFFINNLVTSTFFPIFEDIDNKFEGKKIDVTNIQISIRDEKINELLMKTLNW